MKDDKYFFKLWTLCKFFLSVLNTHSWMKIRTRTNGFSAFLARPRDLCNDYCKVMLTVNYQDKTAEKKKMGTSFNIPWVETQAVAIVEFSSFRFISSFELILLFGVCVTVRILNVDTQACWHWQGQSTCKLIYLIIY